MCQDPALRPKASVLLQHTFLAQAALQYHEQQCINSTSLTNTTQQQLAVDGPDEQNNDDCDENLNAGTDTARQELDDVSTLFSISSVHNVHCIAHAVLVVQYFSKLLRCIIAISNHI
jgi:hypothetical protein